MRDLGLREGFPNLLVLYDGCAYCIELRTGGYVPLPSQRDCYAALQDARIPVTVARSLEDVQPFPLRRMRASDAKLAERRMTRDELIARIGEAYETYRRLPDPDRRYRVTSMTSWPLYVRDAVEAYGYGEVSVRLAAPTPAAIDRADEMLAWMAEHLTHYPIGAKLIWLTYGRGLTMAQCCVYLRKTRGFRRSQAFEKRKAALDRLLFGINAQKTAA
jgi:hypothetical protein